MNNIFINDVFSVDNPLALLCFAVFIPMIFYSRFSSKKKQVQKILPHNLKKKLLVSKIFFWLFLAFGIIAITSPRWGYGTVNREFRRSVDAVIAMDLSRSMETADVRNAENSVALSRMERGIAVMKETVQNMAGMRFAAAAGRSKGLIAIPLTWDNIAVLDWLDALDSSSLTGRSTNLEALLDAAANAFLDSSYAAKLIILVSDGESLSGSVMDAAERCRKNNIIVAALALGSEEGGLVPGLEEIYSFRNTDNMRKISGHTGGIFIDGNLEGGAAKLISYMQSYSSEFEQKENSKELKPRWYFFLILAIISIIVSKTILVNFGKRRRK